MDRAERQRLILVILVIVIVGYLGYSGLGSAFTGVSGLRAAAAKLQNERDQLRQQVQSAQGLVANLGRIRREREALELQLRELSRRLPGEAESAQVLRSVQSLAGKVGLTVSQVRRRPSRPQELYLEIPMEVGVGGSYRDLVRFADQLSQLPRLVTLNELRVQTGAAGATGQSPALAAAPPGGVSAQLVAVVFQAVAEPGREGLSSPTASGAAPAAAAKP